ncbi:MAG: 4'-phosphopantetheinyl transferase family protein [Rudaea sp.]
MNLATLSAADFVRVRPPQPLARDEIHLWFFPQWETFHKVAESRPVRDLLSTYLDGLADALRIERGEHGKPRIAGAALEFNLAHTHGAMLLGVSRNVPLGVDLEVAQRRVRPIELARRFFSPAEAVALAALPEPLCHATFLRLWCAKEAVLKSHGLGIAHGLTRVELAVGTDGAIAAPAASGWRLLPLTPAAAHIGALVWSGADCAVRAFVAGC